MINCDKIWSAWIGAHITNLTWLSRRKLPSWFLRSFPVDAFFFFFFFRMTGSRQVYITPINPLPGIRPKFFRRIPEAQSTADGHIHGLMLTYVDWCWLMLTSIHFSSVDMFNIINHSTSLIPFLLEQAGISRDQPQRGVSVVVDFLSSILHSFKRSDQVGPKSLGLVFPTQRSFSGVNWGK